jgi:uncharacterized lipoprotein YddW (UPF0748 family)
MKSFFFYIFSLTFFSITLLCQTATPKRELRGAWIATVANIDWPSSPHSTSGEKIKELVQIFESLSDAGINTVFFQIRTECDALYDSNLEPWSYWLTGEQGKEPEPYFDPLSFAIDEAHKYGMEFHAWLNPYRVVKKLGEYIQSDNHISVTRPEWILSFRGSEGNYEMLNPGIPAVRDYITGIVTDVVRRYDIDGIHFDDYFYPYVPKISNEDSVTFANYGKKFHDIEDWRRDNINLMVAQVYDSINRINPKIKFGISPFGIIENKYAGTRGFESYSTLYSDPLTWIKQKSVDYLIPQIYWEIGNPRADFSKLLPWWASVAEDVNLYAGLYSSKFIDSSYEGSKSEIGSQIIMIRNTINVQGMVFFSSKTVFHNFSGFADSLKQNYFKYPVLLPSMVWKDSIPPETPENLRVEGDLRSRTIAWDIPEAASDGDTAGRFIIYRFTEYQYNQLTKDQKSFNLDNPEFILHITKGVQNSFNDNDEISPGEIIYMVTALDKFCNESNPAEFIFTNGSEKKEW